MPRLALHAVQRRLPVSEGYPQPRFTSAAVCSDRYRCLTPSTVSRPRNGLQWYPQVTRLARVAHQPYCLCINTQCMDSDTMPISIRDPETDRLARQVAKLTGETI